MPEVPAVPRAAELTAAVARAFAPDGALASALPGFEPRPTQREMADRVARALAEGGVLLAEAGTGTGKTLAYLVPAILSRQRVLVSTGTKNLQEQVFFKDLPALRDALGVPFTATCMKGRANYLCLHRFETVRGTADLRPAAERGLVAVIDEWARHTETGDRAELEELPEEFGLWQEIAATSETCLGTQCPRYQDCFVTRMRQRAAESDIVIVNHHLLCADAAVRQSAYGEVIPSCAAVVIDEAHQLEEVATQYFGVSVSSYRLDELVRDAARVVAAGLVPEDDSARDIAAMLDRLGERSRTFFDGLSLLPGGLPRGFFGAAPADERIRVNAERLEPVADAGASLAGLLEGLESTLALVRDAPEEVRAIERRAAALRQELRFLLLADDPEFVYFLEVRGRGAFLRAAPIDVSAILRETVFDPRRTVVLTSATLSIEESFEYIRGRLGLRHAQALRVPSEFDFARQTILYLPRGMPDPRSPLFPQAASREIGEILTRTSGRAFVLFTSYASLREVQGRLQTTLEYPLLVQGEAPRSVLLRQFRSTPHAVLFATSSFWQGVDVVGEALSCVIIDKLPFASPGDPITAARLEAVLARGGDPFAEYQVPLAILTLLQGLGRLIRHRRDRGVLAVLDPRLRTKGYGRRFLASLPPAPVTNDLRAIERFFVEPESRHPRQSARGASSSAGPGGRSRLE